MNTPTVTTAALAVTAAEIRAEQEAAQPEQPEHRGNRRAPRQWAETVPKSSGSRIVFGKYDQGHEAETVAAALRTVGCPETVSRGPKGTP